MVLKGADVTEVFSPERVTTLLLKVWSRCRMPTCIERWYDLLDPKTQAMVVKRVMSTMLTLVIGSPPCAAFSRIQQLNLLIHGKARKTRFEEDKAKAVLRI